MHLVLAEEIHENADASAFQTVSVQEGGIRALNPGYAESRDWIGRIVACYGVQCARCILDGARDRSGLILC